MKLPWTAFDRYFTDHRLEHKDAGLGAARSLAQSGAKEVDDLTKLATSLSLQIYCYANASEM